MSLTRKDAAATVLTALIVLVFAATHQGWDVWLVGDSHRWAAAVVLGLGAASCSLGTQARERMSRFLAGLGIAALLFGVLALITGSLTWLSLLVADDVLLWAVTTLRHATRHGTRPAVA